ncbi:MAG: hypothetical protein HFJ98_06755 [Eubacterium sp.]|nr:hypothetical protein [Eubacterium sp.]
MKKAEKIENLISFSIKENYVSVNKLLFFFYRFYPPNLSILTDYELEAEISALEKALEAANMAVQIFALDKVEDLSKNKSFFENMDERYKEYTNQIVEQISSHDSSDSRTNSIQRAYYFVISVKSETERTNFEDALRDNNIKFTLINKTELITVFRNFYLREFDAFDLYYFKKELKNKYDFAAKRTKKEND